jgi:hypothetical protein
VQHANAPGGGPGYLPCGDRTSLAGLPGDGGAGSGGPAATSPAGVQDPAAWARAVSQVDCRGPVLSARTALEQQGALTGAIPVGRTQRVAKDGEERERSTWLIEDEDVWGSDGDVAPPVIG